MTRRIK
ncbi:hypothetical protein CJF32_00008724 [Rutstroemia sp. NJR-2017a WRK4]|nr:hypothetical protein CJF32_00008724 [Rutstroemia sp. NJR-2017a WRK4]